MAWPALLIKAIPYIIQGMQLLGSKGQAQAAPITTSLPTSTAPPSTPNPYPVGGNTGAISDPLGGLLVSTQPRPMLSAARSSELPTGSQERLADLESIMVKGPPRKAQVTDPDELKITTPKRPVGASAAGGGFKGTAKDLLSNPEVIAAIANLATGPQRSPITLNPMNTQSSFRPVDSNPFQIIQQLVAARRRR